LVHSYSIINQLYICFIPVFPFLSIYSTGASIHFSCLLIDSFGNWIIVSVVEYLWLFVFRYHEFNITYLFQSDYVYLVVAVVVAVVVIDGILLFVVVVIVVLLNFYSRPLVLMHAGVLILFLLISIIIIILVNVSVYVLFIIHSFILSVTNH